MAPRGAFTRLFQALQPVSGGSSLYFWHLAFGRLEEEARIA